MQKAKFTLNKEGFIPMKKNTLKKDLRQGLKEAIVFSECKHDYVRMGDKKYCRNCKVIISSFK